MYGTIQQDQATNHEVLFNLARSTLNAGNINRLLFTPFSCEKILGSKSITVTSTPTKQNPPPKGSVSTSKHEGNIHITQYHMSTSHSQTSKCVSIDCGTNGGGIGSSAKNIDHTDRLLAFSGINNHEPIVINIDTAGAIVQYHKGEATAIFHSYAMLGHSRSIHSSNQLKHNQLVVNYCSLQVQ